MIRIPVIGWVRSRIRWFSNNPISIDYPWLVKNCTVLYSCLKKILFSFLCKWMEGLETLLWRIIPGGFIPAGIMMVLNLRLILNWKKSIFLACMHQVRRLYNEIWKNVGPYGQSLHLVWNHAGMIHHNTMFQFSWQNPQTAPG